MSEKKSIATTEPRENASVLVLGGHWIGRHSAYIRYKEFRKSSSSLGAQTVFAKKIPTTICTFGTF